MKKVYLLLILLLLFSCVSFAQTRPHWFDVKGKPLVDVEEFGAKGDGAKGNDATDDTISITAAVKYAIDNNQGVRFSPGKVYYITSRIPLLNTAGDVSTAKELIIDGTGATIQMGNSPAHYDSGLSIPPNLDLTIKGLTLKGYRGVAGVIEAYTQDYPVAYPTRIAPISQHNAITLQSAALRGKVKLDSVKFLDIFGDGVNLSLATATSLLITECEFENIAYNCTEIGCPSGDSIITIEKSRALNIGLLPDSFTVDGAATTFNTSTWQIQGSYGFSVYGGIYFATNNDITNFNSTAITATGLDRKMVAKFDRNVVTSASDRSRTANPFGALWGESIADMTVTNNTVNISERNSTDTIALSSGIFVYAGASAAVSISDNTVTAASDKCYVGITTVTQTDSEIAISNNNIRGVVAHSIVVNANLNNIVNSAKYVKILSNTSDKAPYVEYQLRVHQSGNDFSGPSAILTTGRLDYLTKTYDLQLTASAPTPFVASFTIPRGIWLIEATANTALLHVATPTTMFMHMNVGPGVTGLPTFNATSSVYLRGIASLIQTTDLAASSFSSLQRHFIYNQDSDTPVNMVACGVISSLLQINTLNSITLTATRLH